ncbi:MAG TPA: hypothetical protein P5077_08200 [bacterium]|nr:hypothetical protein [bacterium]
MKKFFALCFLVLFAAGAFGQEEAVDTGDRDTDGRKIIYRSKTVIDFEDVMLEGQIKKPSGSFLMDRTKTKFNSLINLKKDFNKELVKSVDVLK